MKFFDAYPRFYDTTATRLLPNRLQQRWRMMIDHNADLLAGARVLDIASHDGRWSFAALKAGASYAEGVEARPELVEDSRENFRTYEVPRDSYAFVMGDAVEYMSSIQGRRFDVILNLGFFYHTLKHLQILELMAGLEPKAFIIDTSVNLSPHPVINVRLEEAEDPRNAVDHLGLSRKSVSVGIVSRAALRLMVENLGYDCVELDWTAHVSDFSECGEYREGRRATFVCRRM